MAALTGERHAPARNGNVVMVPVAADTILWYGGLVAVDTAGNGIPASDTAGSRTVGFCNKTANNTGGIAGNIVAEVDRTPRWVRNSSVNPVGKEHLHGGNIYIEDDNTVSSDGGTNGILAGRGIEIDPTLGVLIKPF